MGEAWADGVNMGGGGGEGDGRFKEAGIRWM